MKSKLGCVIAIGACITFTGTLQGSGIYLTNKKGNSYRTQAKAGRTIRRDKQVMVGIF
jgi:hypothetical protein